MLQMLNAIPHSLAQIYGSNNTVCGYLTLAAMFVDSPTICLHAIAASILSVLAGK